jgi:hypothetical protein
MALEHFDLLRFSLSPTATIKVCQQPLPGHCSAILETFEKHFGDDMGVYGVENNQKWIMMLNCLPYKERI